MKAACLTTINPPRAEFIEPLIEMEFVLYVAGDSKTDPTPWEKLAQRDGIVFVDNDLQKLGLENLGSLLGEGTYARKNLAFAAALRDGATSLWELDDDNYGFRDPNAVFDQIQLFGTKPRSSRWQNLFPLVYGIEDGWFRGFPLDELGSGPTSLEDQFDQSFKPGVICFAVQGEPDVDAIFRLTNRAYTQKSEDHEESILGWRAIGGFSAESFSGVKITEDDFIPLNTQNTLWVDSAQFRWLYHPMTVSMRFSDIFKMHVATSQMPAAYGPETVKQLRNEHSLMADFESEIPMWTKTKQVRELLKTRGKMSLTETYSVLYENRFVDKKEVVCAREFEKLVDALGNY